MNDSNSFDHELGAALNDDGIDHSASAPALGNTGQEWRRRRSRRFAAVGTAAAATLGVVGIGVAALMSGGDGRDIVVTDSAVPPTSAAEVVDVDTTTTLDSVIDTAAPTTDAPVDSEVVATTSSDPTTTAMPPTTDSTVVSTAPPATTVPAMTVPATTAPAAPSAIELNTALVDDTFVVDVDNRLEIRRTTGDVLWRYQYCVRDVECSASLQTITTDDAWVIVGEGRDANGRVLSSQLHRVSLADGDDVTEADAPAGSWFVAGQPTPVGLMLATVIDTTQGFRIAVSTRTDGVDTVLDDDVQSVEISPDGRFLATTKSNFQSGGARSNLLVSDLVTGRAATSTLAMLFPAAREWNADGTRLIVDDAWESAAAFVVDPWEELPEDTPLTRGGDDGTHWEQACFVDASTLAVARWDSPYSEEDAEPGTVILVDADTLSTVGDLGVDTYGSSLVCHPDGTVTYVRIPLITEILGENGPNPFETIRPDFDGPFEIVHVAPDGTLETIATGDFRLDAVR